MFGLKFTAFVLMMTLLVSLVSASMEKRAAAKPVEASRLEKRVGTDCLQCAESYINCFERFGLQGCTDPNAEHFTYCRNCYGVDPSW